MWHAVKLYALTTVVFLAIDLTYLGLIMPNTILRTCPPWPDGRSR